MRYFSATTGNKGGAVRPLAIGSMAVAFAAGAVMLLALSGAAGAAPVHTSDTNVSSWDVGSGQVNGHFSVTSDSAFTGGGIELGLRAEQRHVGAVTPSGDSYLVQAGVDPSQANRAWWNFQLSIGYAGSGGLGSLGGLTLTIQKDAGTNSAPTASGVFDLLALRPFIDDRNAPHSDGTYGDIYQVSQNPVFAPWFTPAYDLSPSSTFAYNFILTALADGQTVSSSMCVHTDGLSCATRAVPEPGTLPLLAGSLIGLGFLLSRRRRRNG